MAIFNLGPLGLPIEKVAPSFRFKPNEGEEITISNQTNVAYENRTTNKYAYKQIKNSAGHIVWELALFVPGKLYVDTPRDKKCYIFMVGRGGNGGPGTGEVGNSSGVTGGNGGGGGYYDNNGKSSITLLANSSYDFSLSAKNTELHHYYYRPQFGDNYICSDSNSFSGGSGASFVTDYREYANGICVIEQNLPTAGHQGVLAYGDLNISSLLFTDEQYFAASGSGGGAVVEAKSAGGLTNVTKGNTTKAKTGGGAGGTTDRSNVTTNVKGTDGAFYGAGGGGSFRDCGNGSNNAMTGYGQGANGILLLRSVENPD